MEPRRPVFTHCEIRDVVERKGVIVIDVDEQ